MNKYLTLQVVLQVLYLTTTIFFTHYLLGISWLHSVLYLVGLTGLNFVLFGASYFLLKYLGIKSLV